MYSSIERERADDDLRLPRNDDSEEGEDSPRPRWCLLLFVAIPQFFGLSLVMPVLPNLKIDFFGSFRAAAQAQSIVDSVRAVLAKPIFSFVVSTEFGRLSDAIGRRPLIALSTICALMPLAAFVASRDVAWYLAAFTLAQALGGSSTPAMHAYVADTVDSAQRRSRAYGVFGATIGTIFAVAPVVGGWVIVGQQARSKRFLFECACACEVVALVAAVCLVRESLVPSKRTPMPRRRSVGDFFHSAISAPLRRLFVVQPQPQGGILAADLVLLQGSSAAAAAAAAAACHAEPVLLRDVAVVKLLDGVSESGLMATHLFALCELVRLTDADLGTVLAASALGGALGQTLVLTLFQSQHRGLGCDNATTVVLSQCFAAAATLAFVALGAAPNNLTLAYALSAVASLRSVGRPALNSLVATLSAKEHDAGLVFGAFAALDAITSFLAPISFATLYQFHPLAPWGLAAFFYAAAAREMRRAINRRRAIDAQPPLRGDLVSFPYVGD